MEKVGGGHDEQAESGDVGAEILPRRKRFGHQRAHGDDRRLGIRAGLLQPVAALDRALLPFVAVALDLLDRAGRQAQIGRFAGRVVDQAERLLHHRRKLVGEGRLIVAQARLAERDQRRVDRLVGAAFRPERNAGGSGDQQEAGVLVAAVVEAIEPAGDERVIERPDRHQPFAEQIARQAERRQHQEKIGFGDAQLDVLALICRRPFLR